MKQRHFYLDLLRVFAISGVVLLHSINTLVITPWLYETASWKIAIVLNEFSRAGVPLFLMISGYLMLSDERSADFSSFYKKRLPRLLIPLFAWNVIYFIGDIIRGTDTSVGGFLAALVNNGTSYHMWFVYTLTGIYLITPFLKKLLSALTQKQLILLILIVLFPTAIRPLINITAPIYVHLFDPLLEGYLGFFLVGYLLGTVTLGKTARICIMLGGIAGAALGIVGNTLACDGVTMNFPFNGGYTVNHYLLAASLFCTAKTLDEKVNIPVIVRKITAKLSNISFGVYWIHPLVITLTLETVILDCSPIKQSVLHFIIVLTVCTLVMLGISYIKPLKKLLM